MNKEYIRKWIAALESGQYTQGKYYLKKGGRHCCLGVACEVAIQNGLELSIDNHGLSYYFDGNSAELPTKVKEWYGISHEDEHEFMLLNDHYELDFKEIARRIREKYEI